MHKNLPYVTETKMLIRNFERRVTMVCYCITLSTILNYNTTHKGIIMDYTRCNMVDQYAKYIFCKWFTKMIHEVWIRSSDILYISDIYKVPKSYTQKPKYKLKYKNVFKKKKLMTVMTLKSVVRCMNLFVLQLLVDPFSERWNIHINT